MRNNNYYTKNFNKYVGYRKEQRRIWLLETRIKHLNQKIHNIQLELLEILYLLNKKEFKE